MKAQRPVALIILDGWGIREGEAGNAVVLGHTPNFDRWTETLERCLLDASGEAVGLPEGQMGNSEVGHMNLGAGRIVYQNLTRINRAIRDGSFFENEVLVTALDKVQGKGRFHLVGLFGEGGVHSHSDHMYALLQLAKLTALWGGVSRPSVIKWRIGSMFFRFANCKRAYIWSLWL